MEGIHMSSVWLMSALDIQAEMQSAAKTKDKVIHVRVASAEEDLPLWVHRILEHSAWLEEG